MSTFSFQDEYDVISNNCQKVVVGLLDQCRQIEDCRLILEEHHSDDKLLNMEYTEPLPRLSLALYLKQNKVMQSNVAVQFEVSTQKS
jgi:hypothetical protein